MLLHRAADPVMESWKYRCAQTTKVVSLSSLREGWFHCDLNSFILKCKHLSQSHSPVKPLTMADGETDANPHHLLVTPPMFSFHPPSSLFCSLIFIFCFFSFTPCHLFPLLTIFFWCFYVPWGDSASFYSLRNKNASWILENFLELKPECSSWKKAKKLK